MIGAGGYMIWFMYGLALEHTPLIVADAIGAVMQLTVLCWAYQFFDDRRCLGRLSPPFPPSALAIVSASWRHPPARAALPEHARPTCMTRPSSPPKSATRPMPACWSARRSPPWWS